MPLRPICVRLSEDVVEQVDALASEAGQERSVWLRTVIEGLVAAVAPNPY